MKADAAAPGSDRDSRDRESWRAPLRSHVVSDSAGFKISAGLRLTGGSH